MASIAVVGAWHQAVVLGACFAELGHDVRGVWHEENVIRRLGQGLAPVYEPELKPLMARHLASGRLRYTTDYREALSGASFAFLAMDTPVAADDSPEVGTVMEEAARLADAVTGNLVLCVSAQVPAGTSARVEALVNERCQPWRCTVAYVPEFLRLGVAIETFMKADRFVIGCDHAAVARLVAALYEPLDRPTVITGLRSAEMAKHACNAFLAASISFINEVAAVCDALGANIEDVVRVMKLDRRIGAHAFLTPGMGFAGGTLGRDVRALQQLARDRGEQTPLLDGVMEVNAGRTAMVIARLRGEYGDLRGIRVGVLGITYKPGTSTLRRSVALELIELLTAAGAEVRACDPLADFTEAPDLPDFSFCEDAYATAQGADALVLVTEWPELRQLDLAELRRRMRGSVLLDTRNYFDPSAALRAGLRYMGVGRGGGPAAGLEAIATSDGGMA